MLSKKIDFNPKVFTDEIEKQPTRFGYGDGVVLAGEKNPDVVVLTADLSKSTHSFPFAQKFPERFFDLGVAEQNLAGISAGLALSGKIPFMASYGVFSPGRNWDQIRVSICYSKANVKIISSHGGLSAGPDGGSHQALEDLALMRVLPGMVVLSPCDYEEAKKATLAAADYNGPVYIRLMRVPTPVITTPTTPFEIGKAQVFMEGTDLTVVSSGPVIYNVMSAVQRLEKNSPAQRDGSSKEYSVEVINSPSIKPLDEATILASVKKTKKLMVVEEHQVAGGLGSAVTEFLSQTFPVKTKLLGMKDSFGESGEYEALLEKYGLSAGSIELEIKNLLS